MSRRPDLLRGPTALAEQLRVAGGYHHHHRAGLRCPPHQSSGGLTTPEMLLMATGDDDHDRGMTLEQWHGETEGKTELSLAGAVAISLTEMTSSVPTGAH